MYVIRNNYNYSYKGWNKMTTQPPAFTPQQFQDALDDLIRIPHGKFAKRHLETVRAALQQCAKGCGDELVKCSHCFGDGIERCDNQDHHLLDALSFRSADESRCPCCGHDEKFRMRTWNGKQNKYEWNKCPECEGSGKIHRIQKGD